MRTPGVWWRVFGAGWGFSPSAPLAHRPPRVSIPAGDGAEEASPDSSLGDPPTGTKDAAPLPIHVLRGVRNGCHGPIRAQSRHGASFNSDRSALPRRPTMPPADRRRPSVPNGLTTRRWPLESTSTRQKLSSWLNPHAR